MREQLRRLVKQRKEFTAIAGVRGHRKSHKGKRIPTLALENVCLADTKEEVAEHLWVDPRKWAHKVEKGHKIKFQARVSFYQKGYHDIADKETDFSLTRIKLICNYQFPKKRRSH